MRKVFYRSLTLAPVMTLGVALLVPTSRWIILERMGFPAPRPARYWMANLDDPDATTRCDAVVYLGFLGPEARESVPALTRALKDPDALVRENAALALLKIGPASYAAVPALGEALEDHVPGVRLYAVLALNELGPQSQPAVPALIKALHAEENWYRIYPFNLSVGQVATSALGRIGSGAREAVPALKAVLKENEPRDQVVAADARQRVTKALAQIEP